MTSAMDLVTRTDGAGRKYMTVGKQGKASTKVNSTIHGVYSWP